MRDLLSLYKYDGDKISIIRGSALAAATGGDPKIGKEAILALMAAVGSVSSVSVITMVQSFYYTWQET